MSDVGPHVKWDNSYDENWAKTVNQWPWKDTGEAWVKRGVCSRCTHEFSFPVPRPIWQGGPGVKIQTFRPVVEQERVYVECDCGHEHEGRPDWGRGCGKNARLANPAIDNNA